MKKASENTKTVEQEITIAEKAAADTALNRIKSAMDIMQGLYDGIIETAGDLNTKEGAYSIATNKKVRYLSTGATIAGSLALASQIDDKRLADYTLEDAATIARFGAIADGLNKTANDIKEKAYVHIRLQLEKNPDGITVAGTDVTKKKEVDKLFGFAESTGTAIYSAYTDSRYTTYEDLFIEHKARYALINIFYEWLETGKTADTFPWGRPHAKIKALIKKEKGAIETTDKPTDKPETESTDNPIEKANEDTPMTADKVQITINAGTAPENIMQVGEQLATFIVTHFGDSAEPLAALINSTVHKIVHANSKPEEYEIEE